LRFLFFLCASLALRDLPSFPTRRSSDLFDRVLCCLVLDHISDLAGVFSEMRRVCRPDGSVVVSIMHPAMMLKGVQARFTDPRTRSEEHTSELQSRFDLVCRLLLEKKKQN